MFAREKVLCYHWLSPMKHRVFTFGIFTAYMVIMTGILIWQGVGITPDRYALVLLLASLLIKKTRSFLLDWIPFLFILISYDFLRSLVGALSPRVDYLTAIHFDEKIFFQLPTITLQKALFHPPTLTWYDYFATVIYFLHFAFPLAFAFLLWMQNKNYFRHFISGILVLSYAAWFTFVIFPAAPPWLADQHGFISGVQKIMDYTLASFPTRLNLPTVYANFNPNPIAAVPSLHAAYPFLAFLFAWRFFKAKALFILPYVFAVWFSIIYLGEHYVFDIVTGVIYSFAAYFITERLLHVVNWDKAEEKLIALKPKWLNI